MLLTITTTHRPATDLGFLLHKHPERVQRFSLPFGAAHVFYPEAGEERCTAALLMDVDPVGLVRRGRSAFALAEYVNDRPYVASSLFSVALVTVFKTAMEGKRPELAASALPLEAALPVVRGSEELVRRLFEPLGYAVEVEPVPTSGRAALRLAAADRDDPARRSCSRTCTCCCRCSTTRSTTGSTTPRSRSCSAAARTGCRRTPSAR